MHYYELAPKENTFKTISVQTTYKCQMACSNCYLGDMLNNDSIPDIDPQKFEAFLDKLPNRVDIRFIGAEPTMNPNLIDLIKLTRLKGHRPSLLTNGLKLRREDYTNQLKTSGLNMLGISMNGGLDDSVYKEFDNGRYAKSKMKALDNCFKYNILPHINVIIDPTNIHIIQDLIDYIVECALRYNRKFSPTKFPVMLRLKSIGKMGNYRDTYSYTLKEMVNLMSMVHDIKATNVVDGYEERRSVIYSFPTAAGEMLCKLTDWTVDDDGVPDAGSERRGILTNNYTVAPFFEYYARYHNERLL